MRSTYRITDMLLAKVARSWGQTRSHEHSEHRRLVDQYGEPESGHAVRIPGHALAVRDMTTATTGAIVPTLQGDYLPALVPFAAPLALGAQIIPAGPGNIAYPRGTTAATAYWLSDEGATQITETQPTIGQLAATPKTVAALVEVTHQALAQSNAEAVIRTEIARAAGAALTQAILAGTGNSGQPTGIVNTANVGTFTGASMTQAHVRNAQADIAAAILDPAAVGFVTTPAVAEVLATRQRFTGSDRTIWEGASHDGTVEGIRALATTGCPAATAVVGDWSQCWVIEFAGGAQILVDPFTKFDRGIVAVRLLLHVDLVFLRAAAFSVATSVS
jgi:HK97 family phage major capsid protein